MARDLFDRLWDDERREDDEYARHIEIERAERAAEHASLPVAVTPPNSRAKGAQGEREFIAAHLSQYWPLARRNLSQAGWDKRDCLEVDGWHFQIKRVERLNVWAALEQAAREASPSDVPVLAFRRNRGSWFCALEASDVLPYLALENELNRLGEVQAAEVVRRALAGLRGA